MKAVNPDAGAELMCATWILEELCVPADFGTRDVVAQAVRLEAKRMGGIEKAAKVILSAASYAQKNGDTINRFWFTDQKYLTSLRMVSPDPSRNNPNFGKQKLRERVSDDYWNKIVEQYRAGAPISEFCEYDREMLKEEGIHGA